MKASTLAHGALSVACAFVALVASARCGSPEPAAPSGDAGGDALDAGDARPDARDDADANASDGADALISDYPGWQRIPGVPNSRADVPIDVGAVVPPLTWTPCRDGVPSCEEFVSPSPGFIWLDGARAENGVGPLLRLVPGFAEPRYETWIYDLGRGVPVAAIRYDLLGSGGGGIAVVGGGGILFGVDTDGGEAYLGRLDGPDLSRMPTLVRVGTIATHPIAVMMTTATTSAIVLQPGSRVFRMPNGTFSETFVSIPSSYQPHLAFGEGDDLFIGDSHIATTEGGSILWAGKDGVAKLLLDDPTGRIVTFVSDGKSFTWHRISGSASVMEVRTAPYTTDPATLRSGTRTLYAGPVQSGGWTGGVAGDGTYAWNDAVDRIRVVRASDGALQSFQLASGWSAYAPVLLTPTHLYEQVRISGTKGGSPLVRFALGAWTPAK